MFHLISMVLKLRMLGPLSFIPRKSVFRLSGVGRSTAVVLQHNDGEHLELKYSVDVAPPVQQCSHDRPHKATEGIRYFYEACNASFAWQAPLRLGFILATGPGAIHVPWSSFQGQRPHRCCFHPHSVALTASSLCTTILYITRWSGLS